MLSFSKTIQSPALSKTFARGFSSSVLVRTKHASKDPEQRMFDRNKKKLEKLEREGHELEKDLKRPGVNNLKKKGERAQIEQGRPDDGVY
ncbi:hypothetical protein C6P41_003984 [Kluyveromyces marxianus]|nr:hypothetical protein C6P43_004641 [Kluyveromyces marxianus]KAG0682121.1 hypothetical protein C6P41_003984 [Kluyveromyces marxianus]